MATFEHTFTTSLEEVHVAVARLSEHAVSARQLDDDALLAAQASLAGATRQLSATASLLAGEVLARSAVSNGHNGLAQKSGFRTPEALIKSLTGSTAREASTLLRVGSILNDVAVAEYTLGRDPHANGETDTAGAATIQESWLICLGAAVASGAISVAGAEAIRNGIGAPTEQVNATELEHATRTLVERIVAASETVTAATGASCIAPSPDPDTLYRWARDARDEIDAQGIHERERHQRAARSLRRWRRPDGMTQYKWELAAEDAALVDGIYDQLTSPRRGGPRFVNDDDKARAEAILHDTRTTEQLASDGFLELLRIGTDTAPTALIGTRKPAVRVLVTEKALRTAGDPRNRAGHAHRHGRGHGHGRIEGHPEPVSIDTVERHTCDSGTIDITFDTNGQAIDVGREQRLFTHRQRIALAARDGGCMAPGCERPPSWTEAHHIKHWNRDHGKTDLDNGILLCRHHHLLFHDHAWEIIRRDHEFWLIPPTHIDPHQTPRRMPSKGPALRDHQHQLRHREHQSA